MQTCTNTQELIPPAPPVATSILFDLAERTGKGAPTPMPDQTEAEHEPGKRRSPEQIQADLETKYKADLDKLNARYAAKIAGASSRVKPVGERRKEALVILDNLRAIVRRTSPVMDEAGIDALITGLVTKEYGDLADGAMSA